LVSAYALYFNLPSLIVVAYFRVVEHCPKKSKFRSSRVERYIAKRNSTTEIYDLVTLIYKLENYNI